MAGRGVSPNPASWPEPQKPSAQTEKSIERLIATESQTEEIMSPPIIRSIAKKTARVISGPAKLPDRLQEPRPGKTASGRNPSWPGRRPPTTPISRSRYRRNGTIRPTSSRPCRSWEPKRPVEPEPTAEPEGTEETKDSVSPDQVPPQTEPPKKLSAREAIDGGLTSLMEAVNDLPGYGKALLLAMLVGLCLINLGGLAAERQQERAAQAAAVRTACSARSRKWLDAAEASLVYRNDQQAKDRLTEAEALIAGLPERNQEQRDNKLSLTQKLQERKESANRVTPLSARGCPDQPQRGRRPRRPKVHGPVWKRGLCPDLTGPKYSPSTHPGMSSMVTKAPEMPVLFLSDGQSPPGHRGERPAPDRHARRTDRQRPRRLGNRPPPAGRGRHRGFPALCPGPPAQPPAPAPGHGQRLTGAGQPYLKDGTDLSRGVSLTVDGNLYILGRDGQVTKLRLGERQDFSLSPVEPPLAGAGKIRTDEKSKSLWILDPGNRRILSFSKETGTFEGQYVHDDLAEANDLLIDEASREALVAKGNAVLRFRLGE